MRWMGDIWMYSKYMCVWDGWGAKAFHILCIHVIRIEKLVCSIVSELRISPPPSCSTDSVGMGVKRHRDARAPCMK